MNEERKPMANITPFGLRMQPELKIRVEEAARANNRSLNAEIVDRLEKSFLTDQERADWSKLISFYKADQRYIEDEYLAGKTDNPMSDIPTGKPETDLVKQINRIIADRTETVGRVVIRELQKKGMVLEAEAGYRLPRQATPEEREFLRNAPADIMPDILDKLASNDIDAALLMAYKAKEKMQN